MINNVEKRLKEVIVKVSKKDILVNCIQEDSDLLSDLEFDSLQFVELIVEIESEFKIVVEDEDLNMNVLGKFSSLLNAIEKKNNFLME